MQNIDPTEPKRLYSPWLALADALDKYDTAAHGVHEDLITNAIWSAIAYLPGVGRSIGLPAGVTWQRGGHGQADIVSEDAKFQLEIKGPHTRTSHGSSCQADCGKERSQFEHIAEIPEVRLWVIAPQSAISRLQREMGTLGLDADPEFLTIGEVASLMRDSLAQALPLRDDPIACLFNVEEREESASLSP